MTAIIGSYEGSDPWDNVPLYQKMIGGGAVATTLFTGQASWTDYVGSVAYADSGTINAQKLWSIPLFANSSSLTEAASGADNSYFVQVAKTLLSNQSSGSIYVRTGWEFNGGWETWSAGTDPADYIKAYQQFVTAFRTVSNRFVFTWCPAESGGGMNPATAYPGDAYVDVIGLDVYDNNTYDGNDPTAAFNTKLNDAYGLNWLSSFAAQHGKQIAIPEWGVNSNNDAAFVTLMANWIKTHNVAYASYWDANAGGFNGQLSSMPAVEAAYVAAFGSSAAATPVTAPASPTPIQPIKAAHGVDFDGDGRSDILWYNSSTHNLQVWESGIGLSGSKAVSLGSVGSSNWSVAGVGDFDGDGRSDVLWENTSSHDVQIWESSKGYTTTATDLGAASAALTVAGVGDFDGDGKSDVLWWNAGTRTVQVWESSIGLNAAHAVTLGTVSAGWSIEGVGDFDGDGKADILWMNSTTRDVQVWESTKGYTTTKTDLGLVSAGWNIEGVGDFDGDGKSDILWQNASTGDVQIWESTKGYTQQSTDLGVVKGWTIVGVGDFDGDGKADILWENTTTHDVQVWESSHGLNAANAIDLGAAASGYSVATLHYSL